MLEIEKRYDINSKIPIPKDKIKSQYRIEQVYSNISPDVRIRKITDTDDNETYFHCVKYILKSGIREEIEQPITKEQYDNIFEVIDKKPVAKDRFLIDLDNNLTAEIDTFLDTNKTIIEVEFPDEKTMKDFVPPDFFGSEIKNKQSYSVCVFSKINDDLNGIERLKYYIDT